MHAPLVGPYLLGTHAAMPGRGMYLSVVDRARFAEHSRAAYTEVLADPDERALTWTWPRSIPLGLPSDRTDERFAWLEAGVRDLRIPATIIWGREDDVFPLDVFAARWHEIWPHAEGTHLVTGRHFLQEDSGAEIGDLLADFATRTDADAEQPMSGPPVVLDPAERPDGHRAVPLLTEPALGHYPEFRRFLVDTFGLDADRVGPSGPAPRRRPPLRAGLLGRSGQAVPVGRRDPGPRPRPGAARRAGGRRRSVVDPAVAGRRGRRRVVGGRARHDRPDLPDPRGTRAAPPPGPRAAATRRRLRPVRHAGRSARARHDLARHMPARRRPTGSRRPGGGPSSSTRSA